MTGVIVQELRVGFCEADDPWVVTKDAMQLSRGVSENEESPTGRSRSELLKPCYGSHWEIYTKLRRSIERPIRPERRPLPRLVSPWSPVDSIRSLGGG